WGREHDCCAARLNDRRELSIVKARHPLIDPAIVVANTYRLAPPKTTLLITGPNTGGKTVSMKIIGLFTLMTYAGMPIPCEEADIPYFDQVFADIGDDQSVAESLSSFSAHIRKQAEVCRKATGDSLVLLDEVGSGTDPREGESLAIAILNELRGRGCMTVATTHYGRLKAYGKRHDDVLTASVQFDMEKLAPTYRFMEGTTGQSNAFAVAQRYGLPEHIVKYARFLKDQARSQEDTLIETLEAQVAQSDKQKDALAQAIAENEALKKQLEKEKAMFEKERDTWRLKAQKEADAYILKAQKEADEVLKEMRTNGMKYHEALNLKQKLAVVQEESMPEPVKDDGVFAVGDAVELRSSNQVGEVVEVGKRELTVEFNGRRIRVRPAQIRHSAHVIVKNKPQASVKMTSGSIFSSMPIECNLIGMRADEAKDSFSSYLDQAKLHGLRYFRVIHGDGSGALRKVVHDILKKDRSVKEYRLGQANEGGSGATIVTLK
ncbi:MAG: Smr/MutS family protein, partial [Solobacterium sp.]|nr:Smr/MutS family protein [Solobacterium sp.]